MPISVQCPGCKKLYTVGDEMGGKGVQCKCGAKFLLPQRKPPVKAAPAASWIADELAAEVANRQAQAALAVQVQMQQSQIASQESSGLWRDGNTLIVHKNAVFPDICVKSNQPAHGMRLRRRLSWHHPAIMLTVFLGVCIYVILALVMTKSATIEVGISPKYILRRRLAALAGAVVALCGGVVFFFGLLPHLQGELMENAPHGLPMMVCGAVIMFVGVIGGMLASRLVYASQITDHYVWLKGVHPGFLSRYPRWQRR